MAISPLAKYFTQIDGSDPTGYPYGAARDDLTPDDGTGTPLQEDWVNDVFGLQQALLNEASIVPSGTPDKVGSSQYLDAIKAVIQDLADQNLKTLQLENWDTYQVDTFTGSLSGIRHHSSGVFITVGANDELQSSFDGITWTRRTSGGGPMDTLYGTAFDGTTYVAVGMSGRIKSSTNLATWTARTAANGYTGSFTDIIYRPPGDATAGFFCAIGTSGEIQTSASGATWTKQTQAGAYAGFFNRIAYGNELLVAVGDSGEIQTSQFAETWVKRTPGGGYSNTFFSVAYGNGIFVATGVDGEIQTSPDGINWTSRTDSGLSGLSSEQVLLDVTFGDGEFCIVGGSGAVQTSPDGINWTQRLAYPRQTVLVGVAYGDNCYVSCGTGGRVQKSLRI